jgi:hypothetical protein
MPEPNGAPTPLPDGGRVEHRVCSCCKPEAKTRRRFFVLGADDQVVCMALTWESLCRARGWEQDQNDAHAARPDDVHDQRGKPPSDPRTVACRLSGNSEGSRKEPGSGVRCESEDTYPPNMRESELGRDQPCAPDILAFLSGGT